MTQPKQARGAGLTRWLHQARAEFTVLIAPPKPPEPGLHTYRLSLPGGQRRLHLRSEANGTGVLFVDVTEVIHLNPTA
ncbi:MAG: hypothetical protein JXB35_06270, partial [Anaerolineae bacterium]|nr:hypothetical protein [Anaerolineae bacterium]